MPLLDDGINVLPRRRARRSAPVQPTAEPERPQVTDREYTDVVSSLTVAEVVAAVRSGSLDRDRVVAAERAGKQRYGILDALR